MYTDVKERNDFIWNLKWPKESLSQGYSHLASVYELLMRVDEARVVYQGRSYEKLFFFLLLVKSKRPTSGRGTRWEIVIFVCGHLLHQRSSQSVAIIVILDFKSSISNLSYSAILPHCLHSLNETQYINGVKIKNNTPNKYNTAQYLY